ncbi:MAG: methyl-accepting chemotaxis protein [Ignavibacteriae bacterium]|nr:methyl-accepting chemotaxis protein [Ignavibacteriota bacterium]
MKPIREDRTLRHFSSGWLSGVLWVLVAVLILAADNVASQQQETEVSTRERLMKLLNESPPGVAKEPAPRPKATAKRIAPAPSVNAAATTTPAFTPSVNTTIETKHEAEPIRTTAPTTSRIERPAADQNSTLQWIVGIVMVIAAASLSFYIRRFALKKGFRITRFQDWSISLKVIGVSVVSILSLAMIIGFYVLPKVQEKIYDEKRTATSNIVDVAYAVIAEFDSLAQRGEFSVEEAQRRAKQSVQALRYNEKEYFWINDLAPRMIMHPYKPELNGKDLSENKDPNGKRLFMEFVRVCREQGEGYVDYMWPKPGADKPVPKVSYVKLYKPWGWIVGSGIYVDDVESQMAGLRWLVLSALIVGLLVSVFIGVLIGRMMARPLKEMLQQLDNADLNTVLESDRRDEIGDLTRSFDRFIASIKETLLKVREASIAVASASAEISSSTEQMAAGAQEQTSQAGEVASAVEEMTKTIIENSKNASDTAATANKAKQAAEKGGLVVEETVQGMRRIADVVKRSASTVRELGKSSNQIGEIISVIDDIADQTNLLALNAAIEAARAGEQGRGFAVVADEVRKLAERTTKATKEIATMIKKIQSDTGYAVLSMEQGTQEVDEGIAFADKAGVSLREIVGISQTVTDMVTQIAAASEQQSSASEEISKNVEGISSVTGETAQGTEQIAHAAEDLNRLTEDLLRVVERFKLTDEMEHRKSAGHHAAGSGSGGTLAFGQPRARASAQHPTNSVGTESQQYV